MKLKKRFKKLFVTAVVSSVFVSLTASNIVYAGGNTRLGSYAGRSLTSSASYNTLIGYSSGRNNKYGDYNTFLGGWTGYNSTASNNTFIGMFSGFGSTTGGYNAFLGSRSGMSNTTGHGNTFLGYASGSSNSKGYRNTFLGNSSGSSNNTGRYNSFLGYLSGSRSREADYNTFLGSFSGRYNTTGSRNTFLGYASGYRNKAGFNTFIGMWAGGNNTKGQVNTFLGLESGYRNVTGSGNVFLGNNAGYFEEGSNKLYIDNKRGETQEDTIPLIYGDFATGQVAIGTTNLVGKLTLRNADRIVFDNTTTTDSDIGWRQNDQWKAFFEYYSTADEFRWYLGGGNDSDVKMVLEGNGNVGIGTTDPQGTLDVNGAIFQRGGQLHADYVFETDYKLESIKDHAKFMWKEKHLKAIPKATVDKNGIEVVEVGAHRKGIVEELEKAHIYISQLHGHIGHLEGKLKQQDKMLEKRLAKLEEVLKTVQ